MMMRITALLFLVVGSTYGFTAPAPGARVGTCLHSEATAESAAISVDPKEAVKLFGRLADKYILLDSSGE